MTYDMIDCIKITLDNDVVLTLEKPDTLHSCEKDKRVSLMLSDCNIYTGFFVKIDSDGEVVLQLAKTKYRIGIPFETVIGWYYTHRVVSKADYNSDIAHCEGTSADLCKRCLRRSLHEMGKGQEVHAALYLTPPEKNGECSDFIGR